MAGTLEGEIVYRGERRGVAGAVVLFRANKPGEMPVRWTLTQGPGSFRIGNVPPGRYFLHSVYGGEPIRGEPRRVLAMGMSKNPIEVSDRRTVSVVLEVRDLPEVWDRL